MGYKTEQENFWAGKFGNEYILRNKSNVDLAAQIGTFAKILSCVPAGGHLFLLGVRV